MNNCFLVRYPRPKITIIYTLVLNNEHYWNLAKRFVNSVAANPPGYPCGWLIGCNRGVASPEQIALFSKLGQVDMFVRDNSGWDIGTYIDGARIAKTESVVCFGAHAYVQKPGWLMRLVEAWEKFGPGLYGTLASYEIMPHIQTTGFLCPKELLTEYPWVVASKEDRYDFEHSNRALWVISHQAGYPTMLVTWDGEYPPKEWRNPPNIYRRGHQGNCVTFFVHSDNYAAFDEHTKRVVESQADHLNDPSWPWLIRQ